MFCNRGINKKPNKNRLTMSNLPVVPSSFNYKKKLELTRRNQAGALNELHNKVKEAKVAEIASHDLGHLGDVCDNVAMHVAKICGGEDILRDAPDDTSTTHARMIRVEKQIYNVLRAVSLLANHTSDLQKDMDAVNGLLSASLSDLDLDKESAHYSRTYSGHIKALESLEDEETEVASPSHAVSDTPLHSSLAVVPQRSKRQLSTMK